MRLCLVNPQELCHILRLTSRLIWYRMFHRTPRPFKTLGKGRGNNILLIKEKGSKIPLNFILLVDFTPTVKSKLILTLLSINLTNISLIGWKSPIKKNHPI